MNVAKYTKVFEIGLQNTFVYRWNFLLRTVFGIVPLVGTIYLWKAVFQASDGSIAGYEYSTMIFYFMVTVFLDNLITPTEDEWQIAADIRDGRISALLIKPLNYLAYRASLYLGYRLLYIGVVFLPILGLAFMLREHIQVPQQWTTWPVFALSVLMAAGIQFLLAYTLALIAFWVLEISTIVFIVYSFEFFLSGQAFPLDVLPGWLQGFVKWSPFTYEMFFPVQIAMERVKGAELVEGLCIQAIWLMVIFLAARILWRRGVRKYQAVGA